MQIQFEAHRLAEALSALLWSGRTYRLGAKLGLGIPPARARESAGAIDCSGFTRWVLHHASNGHLSLSGGTMSQRTQLEALGYEPVPTEEIATRQLREDQHLRIGFRGTEYARNADGSYARDGDRLVVEEVGHVWLVIDGMTFESSERLNGNGPMVTDSRDQRSDGDYLFNLGPVPGWRQSSYDILFAHDAALNHA